eukprot:13403637-Ditylum_brightwellii.AAC.1
MAAWDKPYTSPALRQTTPIKALVRRINHILQHGGREDAPLCAYYHDHQFKHVTPEHLVNLLRAT